MAWCTFAIGMSCPCCRSASAQHTACRNVVSTSVPSTSNSTPARATASALAAECVLGAVHHRGERPREQVRGRRLDARVWMRRRHRLGHLHRGAHLLELVVVELVGELAELLLLLGFGVLEDVLLELAELRLELGRVDVQLLQFGERLLAL